MPATVIVDPDPDAIVDDGMADIISDGIAESPELDELDVDIASTLGVAMGIVEVDISGKMSSLEGVEAREVTEEDGELDVDEKNAAPESTIIDIAAEDVAAAVRRDVGSKDSGTGVEGAKMMVGAAAAS